MKENKTSTQSGKSKMTMKTLCDSVIQFSALLSVPPGSVLQWLPVTIWHVFPVYAFWHLFKHCLTKGQGCRASFDFLFNTANISKLWKLTCPTPLSAQRASWPSAVFCLSWGRCLAWWNLQTLNENTCRCRCRWARYTKPGKITSDCHPWRLFFSRISFEVVHHSIITESLMHNGSICMYW